MRAYSFARLLIFLLWEDVQVLYGLFVRQRTARKIFPIAFGSAIQNRGSRFRSENQIEKHGPKILKEGILLLHQMQWDRCLSPPIFTETSAAQMDPKFCLHCRICICSSTINISWSWNFKNSKCKSDTQLSNIDFSPTLWKSTRNPVGFDWQMWLKANTFFSSLHFSWWNVTSDGENWPFPVYKSNVPLVQRRNSGVRSEQVTAQKKKVNDNDFQVKHNELEKKGMERCGMWKGKERECQRQCMSNPTM